MSTRHPHSLILNFRIFILLGLFCLSLFGCKKEDIEANSEQVRLVILNTEPINVTNNRYAIEGTFLSEAAFDVEEVNLQLFDTDTDTEASDTIYLGKTGEGQMTFRFEANIQDISKILRLTALLKGLDEPIISNGVKLNTTISPPTPPLEFKHAGRDITFTRLATRDVGGNVGDFIEIVNSSNADITIIGVTLDTHPHIFLNPFSPRTLKSGSSTVVNFDFNALGATDGDTYSTILRIVHSALPAGISDEPINISFKYTKPSFPIYEFADTSNITANILDNDPINFFFPGEVRGFAIKNTGQADLNISSISISGTDFTLANAGGTLSIKPGDSHIFRITMNVTSASGTLSIVEGSSITHTYNLQNPL